MEKVKIIYDREGNTLNVWFKDPSLEYVCEETGEEIILVKDKEGNVIGFEVLNFLKGEKREEGIAVESLVL